MQRNSTSPKADMPVFMIGIDGADWRMVQRLLRDGKLPALYELMQQGCHGQLASPADEYAGGVWPDFYTGQTVAQHGIYHNKLWRQRNMRCEVPTDEWLPARPFYETLSDLGYRVCVLDMPMVLGTVRKLNGFYLGGWGTHDLIAKGAYPAGLWQQLRSAYGAPVMPAESFGRQTARELVDLRDHLLRSINQMTNIGADLLASETWDFACIVLGATHRAGHYLWDDSQLANASAGERRSVATALEEIYVASDQALAQLLQVAPDNAMKIVFAVHGMKANHGWSDLGHDLLEAVFQSSRQQKPKRGLFYRLRRGLPFHFVRPVLTRLPPMVTDRLLELWSGNMYDWQSTPYFPLPMDQAGYIRINLRGRESQGIVAPGAAYNRLCNELTRYLCSLKDADTGRAVVASVIPAWKQAPKDAAARDVLPDLVVIWSDVAASRCRRLLSDQLPGFDFEVPQYNLSGRSGNHAGYGWFVAHGSGLISKGLMQGYTIRDLAPSVFHALGETLPKWFESRDSIWQCEETGESAHDS